MPLGFRYTHMSFRFWTLVIVDILFLDFFIGVFSSLVFLNRAT